MYRVGTQCKYAVEARGVSLAQMISDSPSEIFGVRKYYDTTSRSLSVLSSI